MKFVCDIFHPNGSSRSTGPTPDLTAFSVQGWDGVYFNPSSPGRRPESLRTEFGAMVPRSKCREDSFECDEHAR